MRDQDRQKSKEGMREQDRKKSREGMRVTDNEGNMDRKKGTEIGKGVRRIELLRRSQKRDEEWTRRGGGKEGNRE